MKIVSQILCSKEKVKDKFLLWNSLALPDTVQMDKIISTLKNGIKTLIKLLWELTKSARLRVLIQLKMALEFQSVFMARKKCST